VPDTPLGPEPNRSSYRIDRSQTDVQVAHAGRGLNVRHPRDQHGPTPSARRTWWSAACRRAGLETPLGQDLGTDIRGMVDLLAVDPVGRGGTGCVHIVADRRPPPCYLGRFHPADRHGRSGAVGVVLDVEVRNCRVGTRSVRSVALHPLTAQSQTPNLPDPSLAGRGEAVEELARCRIADAGGSRNPRANRRRDALHRRPRT
jgi:hypothetical protein